MTDLTEQWKKGELPSGEYYIIDDLGLHTTDKYYPSHGFGTELPQSVLGRVPTYKEWQEFKDANDSMFDTIKMLNKDNYKLEAENDKLKELLKECRDVAEFTKTIVNKHKWLDGVITKINQALGEDK